MFSSGASQVSSSKLFVDDCFACTTYTGNGSTQTITNGIDLAGNGGLVWIKRRGMASNHFLCDTANGATKYLRSDQTNGLTTYTDTLTGFTSTGFTLGADATTDSVNVNTRTHVSWTFRKAPKFFDVVTWTGNGVAGRQIAHSLGVAPGMIFVKKTSAAADWQVYHRSVGATGRLRLNLTDATQTTIGAWNNTEPTATDFTLYNLSENNEAGATYVAYLFAHDTSTDGMIQCGSFTTDGSGNATVNHGWSAGVQFAKIKASSTTSDWEMFDSARSPAWSADNRLRANLSNAEDTVTRLSASGTSISFTGLSASQTYIYVFIVAPT